MSWSYSGNPSTSLTDAVRFLLGDVDTSDQQLSNEEILWLLSQNSNSIYLSTAQGALNVAAKYARLVDKTVGDLSLSYSQLQQQYKDLAAVLTIQASTKEGLCGPYAGGISIADKEVDEGDADRVKPAFTVGMHNTANE